MKGICFVLKGILEECVCDWDGVVEWEVEKLGYERIMF